MIRLLSFKTLCKILFRLNIRAGDGFRYARFIPVLSICFFVISCGDPTDLDLKNLVSGDESVNERFDSSMEWNKKYLDSVIIVPSDNYQVYCMADSHIGSIADEHEGGTANFDNILSIATADNVAAMIIAGDIGTGRSKDNILVHEHLLDHSLSYYPLIGNHDLFFDGWKSFFEVFGSSTYCFSITTPVARDLFICLDSGNGTLGSKQTKWFKNILKTIRSDYRHCIVFSHNNLFRIPQNKLSQPPVTTPPVEEINLLLDLFARYKVNAFISGHAHETKRSILGNTAFLIIGTCFDGSDFPCFLKIELQNGKTGYKFVNL